MKMMTTAQARRYLDGIEKARVTAGAQKLAHAFARMTNMQEDYEAACKEVLGADAINRNLTLSPEFDAAYVAALKLHGLPPGDPKHRNGVWKR